MKNLIIWTCLFLSTYSTITAESNLSIDLNECLHNYNLTFFYNNNIFNCNENNTCPPLSPWTDEYFNMKYELTRVTDLLNYLSQDLNLGFCFNKSTLVNFQNDPISQVESFFKNSESPWDSKNIRVYLYHNSSDLDAASYSKPSSGDFIKIPIDRIFDPAIILHEIIHKHMQDRERMHVVFNSLQNNYQCQLVSNDGCMNLMYQNDILPFNILLTDFQSNNIRNKQESPCSQNDYFHSYPLDLINSLDQQDLQFCCEESDISRMGISKAHEFYELIREIIAEDFCNGIITSTQEEATEEYNDDGDGDGDVLGFNSHRNYNNSELTASLDNISYSDTHSLGVTISNKKDTSRVDLKKQLENLNWSEYREIQKIFRTDFEKLKLPKIEKYLTLQEDYYNMLLIKNDNKFLSYKKGEYVNQQIQRIQYLLKRATKRKRKKKRRIPKKTRNFE